MAHYGTSRMHEVSTNLFAPLNLSEAISHHCSSRRDHGRQRGKISSCTHETSRFPANAALMSSLDACANAGGEQQLTFLRLSRCRVWGGGGGAAACIHPVTCCAFPFFFFVNVLFRKRPQCEMRGGDGGEPDGPELGRHQHEQRRPPVSTGLHFT